MRFRSKIVEIDAYQFDNRITNQPPHWLTKAIEAGDVWYQGGQAPYLTIRTLEGEMRANVGDWVIRGTEGELYPCKPSVFERKYEPAPINDPECA